MPVAPEVIAQVLRTPSPQDVTRSPLVRAVILGDPANAADLVPALGNRDSVEAGNARRILCLFEPPAVPYVLGALPGAPARVREQAIEVVWALLTGEPPWLVAATFATADADLDIVFGDRSPLDDELPEPVERDFRGRVCDLAYLVVRQLADPDFDQSAFRACDDVQRDEEIRRFRAGRRLQS
jgi:hypothetical protein